MRNQAAYKRHIRSREVPCEPCRLVERDASRDAMRARRAAEREAADRQQRDIRALVALIAEALTEEDRCERCPACLRSLSPRRRTCQRCGAQVARAAA